MGMILAILAGTQRWNNIDTMSRRFNQKSSWNDFSYFWWFFLRSLESIGLLVQEKFKIDFQNDRPSWISHWNDLSCFWSTSHPDISYQVFSQVAFYAPPPKKWRGIMLYPLKFWVSVRPSVSAPTILLPATPSTVLGQSFSNFTGTFRMVWRYAYCFFQNPEIIFYHIFSFLT